jgi:hypothetical protein
MGPTSGGAASPTYRAITTSDLPPIVLSVSNIDGTLTISPTSGAVFASIPTSVALPGSPTTTTQSAGDNSTKISTTAFVTTAVNNAISGVNPAVAVQAATNTILPNSPTYSNGVSGVGATLTAGANVALTVDGYSPVLNDRVLVKNQGSAFQNGVYTSTQTGTGLLPWILTRSTDYNQPSDINNTGAIPVTNGIVNLDTSWVLTSKVNTVGTDSLTYTQFSLNPTTIITGGGNLSPLFTTSSSANTISFSQISQNQSTFFASPSSGGTGLPMFRNIGGSDISSAITAGSNVTIATVNNQLVISSTASGGGSSTYSTTVQSTTPVTLTTSSTYLQECNASTQNLLINLFSANGNFKEFLFVRPDNSAFTVTVSANGTDLFYTPNGVLTNSFVFQGSSVIGANNIPSQGATARFTSNGVNRFYISQ